MIPKQITVGARTYEIKLHDELISGRYQGECNYGGNTIDIATHATYDTNVGRLRVSFNDDEIKNTFWHELTHAILHEMGNPLASNERFVTKFSTLLSDAIDSAKL